MSDNGLGDIAENAKSGLTQKIGGVPFYVYGAVFVAGFYVWTRYRKPKVAAEDLTAQTADVAVDPKGTDYGTPTAGRSAYVIGSAAPGATNGVTNSSISQGEQTIEDWIRNGTVLLTGLGYDATNSNTALRLYATGGTPTGSQNRLVQLVTAKQGVPAGHFPIENKDVQLGEPTRIIRNDKTGGVYIQYEDGSLVHVADMTEWAKLRGPSGVLKDLTIVEISSNDPIWANVVQGNG